MIGVVGSLLDSFLPSAVKISGKCIKVGCLAYKILYKYKCFEVLVSHYTPLITWVIPIFQSSITFAKW